MFGTPTHDTMEMFRKSPLKRLCFELALKSLKASSDDKIKSFGRIALAMHVQQHIFNFDHLDWKDSQAKVLYVDLKAPDNDYTTQNVETDEVELV